MSKPMLSLRVGCLLAYDCPQPVPVVFKLTPQPGADAYAVQEFFAIDSNLRAEAFFDDVGNYSHRLLLPAGRHQVRHDAVVSMPFRPDIDTSAQPSPAVSPAQLAQGLLRYTLPSRYCDSDKLLAFAWERFSSLPPGLAQAQAASDWIHKNLEYRFGSGNNLLSAWDVLQRGYGVCRDFAHLHVALCRAMNLPARYASGHLPDIGHVDPSPMDFHAYSEVYLESGWRTFDARYNEPRIGRLKIAHGLDAVDCAFATFYGPAVLTHFEVWAYQIRAGSENVGDPVNLSNRLDGSLEIRPS